MKLYFPDIAALIQGDNNVVLYTTSLSMVKCYNHVSNLWSFLNQSEQKVANSYHTRTLAENYIISRVILKQILANHIKLDTDHIDFIYNEYGKPYLKNNPYDIQFNLSHSNDILCVAVTRNYHVGVDIEFKNSSLNIEELCDFIFTEKELKYLQILESTLLKQSLFYNLWTAKEAIVKAIGYGLSYPMNQINLIENSVIINSTIFIDQDQQQKQWYYTPLNLKENYGAAIASEMNFKHIFCLELDSSNTWSQVSTLCLK